jgi:hypothetical protein
MEALVHTTKSFVLPRIRFSEVRPVIITEPHNALMTFFKKEELQPQLQSTYQGKKKEKNELTN